MSSSLLARVATSDNERFRGNVLRRLKDVAAKLEGMVFTLRANASQVASFPRADQREPAAAARARAARGEEIVVDKLILR